MLMTGCLTPARGDGQDRAAAERSRGRILALERLVQQVSALLPGRMLEVEFEEDDGVPVYELTWLLPDGRRLEIELDARDGRWLSLQGPRLETAFRRAPVSSPAAPGAGR
ncbi:PepSY domain-containing protein [Azohydromonas caseinilytica]|uniref:Peptidase n=1 Tax=Azohydromonas caseinilytica TaxID=2728836 RepID=A0A848FDU3_9BURK|nr:PepSY domain-containing protein [Azohydromonas caseinilytica]NML18377.1 peptidase [Azohydromonas caseinilytica]